jgi:hypothetical protein
MNPRLSVMFDDGDGGLRARMGGRHEHVWNESEIPERVAEIVTVIALSRENDSAIFNRYILQRGHPLDEELLQLAGVTWTS